MTRLATMGMLTPQRPAHDVRNAYPFDVVDLLTDILADLVLEDLKQFPQIATGPRIDRFGGRENTMSLTQVGGA